MSSEQLVTPELQIKTQKDVNLFKGQYLQTHEGELRKDVHVRNYRDASKYEGYLSNDKREGKGIYHFANKDKYFGD